MKDISGTEQTGQWVYVVEKCLGQVKIGFSANPEFRIQNIESQGGFRAKRMKTFGPFQNGNKIECAAHKELESCRFIGEWFNVDFERAVAVVSDMASKIGHNNPNKGKRSPDYAELFNSIWPFPPMDKDFEGVLKGMGFRIVRENVGALWLEHDDYGLMSLDFFRALTMAATTEMSCHDATEVRDEV